MTNELFVTKLFCEYGFSSETYDFWYETVLATEDGQITHIIPGGRLSYKFLRLFFKPWRGKSCINFGHGYDKRRKMDDVLSERKISI